MTVRELAEQIDLSIVAGEAGLNTTVTFGMVSDLLSNVMGMGDSGGIWVTMHVHQNIVAVASLSMLSAVIVAGGADPDGDTIAKAEIEGIPLFTTDLSQFEVCGQIYALGIKG